MSVERGFDYVMADEEGRIVQFGIVPAYAADRFEAPAGLILVAQPGHWDSHYVSAGNVLLRPGLDGIPEKIDLKVGCDWSVPDVPVGTEVWIDGVSSGLVDEAGLVLNFPMAEVWEVQLVPPFPTIAASCVVTVR